MERKTKSVERLRASASRKEGGRGKECRKDREQEEGKETDRKGGCEKEREIERKKEREP